MKTSKTSTSPSLEWAANRYITIRQTLKQAKDAGVNIVQHSVKFTEKGMVYQHLFVVKNEDGSLSPWTNQDLSGFLWVHRQSKKQQQ